MIHKNKLFSLLIVLALSAFIFVPTAYAYDGRGGDRVVIGADEVINDDLYLGGDEVIVDGVINGDLMAAGSSVTINGKVSGDVFAAGSSITINGEIGDDLYAGAQVVTIGSSAKIKDDTFGGAYSFETRTGSQIGGSLLLGAYQALISGNVMENLKLGGERARLEGIVEGNAEISVNTSDNSGPNPMAYSPNMPAMPSLPGGLTFGAEAKVNGSLTYVSETAIAIPSVVTSEIDHQLPAVDEQVAREMRHADPTSSWAFDSLRRMISLIVIGLLLAWLLPNWIKRPAAKVSTKPLPSLGLGLVSLVAVPMLILIAVAVVILTAILVGALTLGQLVSLILAVGLPAIFLAFMAFILIVSYLCQAIIAYLGGKFIFARLRPEWNEKIYWPLLAGLALLGIIFAIPVAGGIIQFIIVLVGLGALALLLWERLQPKPLPQAEIPPVIEG